VSRAHALASSCSQRLAHASPGLHSNPFLNKTFTCERFGGYDTIAVSTVRACHPRGRPASCSRAHPRPVSSQGTWQTALNCATYDTLRKELEHLFSAWPRLAYECRRPITPRNLAILDSSTARATRFIWLNLPAFHPQLHRHDCRTGPRLHFWNERFGRLARRHGWEVVDVESLTKPIAIDMTLGDGVHCEVDRCLLSRVMAALTSSPGDRHRDRRGGTGGRRLYRQAGPVRRDVGARLSACSAWSRSIAIPKAQCQRSGVVERDDVVWSRGERRRSSSSVALFSSSA